MAEEFQFIPPNSKGWVIESAIHGVYTGVDWSTTGNSYGPRFRYSIGRSQGQVFPNLIRARQALCMIRLFRHYSWKAPSWLATLYFVSLDNGEIIDE